MNREKGHLFYCRHSWPLYADASPCDAHFIRYLRERNVAGKSIFHFGTGEHHLVGKDNHERGNPNEILGVTASYQKRTRRSKEHETYIDFVMNNPAAANYYKVLFADIYTLSPAMLPSFDVVTLFHLFEFYDEEYSAYARLNDISLLEMFLGKLNPGGRLMLFPKTGSDVNVISKQCKAAIANTAKTIDDFVSKGKMDVDEQFESIVIFKRHGD